MDRFYGQKLHWKICANDLQCSSFKVPIDYEKPNGGNFTLQVLRHPATGNKKLGSILVNPGGPGGSALDYAAGATEIVSKALYSQYDIVGFDERGVGSSEPIRCLSDKAEDDFINQDSKVEKFSDLTKMVKTTQFFANACLSTAGKKLGHVSTLEAAKDMDI